MFIRLTSACTILKRESLAFITVWNSNNRLTLQTHSDYFFCLNWKFVNRIGYKIDLQCCPRALWLYSLLDIRIYPSVSCVFLTLENVLWAALKYDCVDQLRCCQNAPCWEPHEIWMAVFKAKKKKRGSRAARFCLAVLHHLSTQNIVSEPNQPAITARTNPSHRPQRARPNNSPLRKPSTQHLCSQLYHRSTNSAPRRRPQRRGGERGSRQYLPTKRM